jgi:glycosyltransferase involved in cell wall biosynthesis
LKLLFITNVYPSPWFPGKGVFNLRMTQAMVDLGHEVEVICPVSWIDRVRNRHSSVAASSPQLKDTPARYPTFYYPPRTLRSAYGWLMWQSIKPAVLEIARRSPPDAVVAYWAHPDGRCAITAARLLDVPCFVMTGGSDVLVLTKNLARRRQVLNVLKEADGVIAVNDHLRQTVVANGVSPSNVFVVRRGIDRSIFKPGDRAEARSGLGLPSDIPIALWVGRMVAIKGLQVLLNAAKRLRELRPHLRFYLIGSGEEMPAIRKDIARNNLTRHVILVGPVRDAATLADWYRAANVTVLPSFSEGVPNVLLESIAIGTPFVASDVGGVAEIATDGLDHLVTAGDCHGLAAEILVAIDEQASANVRRSFLPHSTEDAARQLINTISAKVNPKKSDVESHKCLQLIKS